ncbi:MULTISPECIES: hypothetical protein [Yersinia]|uniref:hypothetical protein n=1 Tax=Yersinia TaxID=629 RepID=UPI0009B6F8E8|nr:MULTISPECIES: hypothetical protein [Yersinia]ARB86027.1 hypothetical protein A6J67_20065 [Yersinia sp. FDAARGOS_228]AVL35875.1 hypothetical protein CEQ36_09745 [Yersinia intermedia]
MNKLTEQEFTRKPDGGLADQIEVLEAMAEGDAYNTELLMLLIELRSLREQLAELKALQPVAIIDIQHDRPDGNLFAITFTRAGHALKDDVYELFTAAKQ